jgi:hypothetical protein
MDGAEGMVLRGRDGGEKTEWRNPEHSREGVFILEVLFRRRISHHPLGGGGICLGIGYCYKVGICIQL